MTGVGTRVWFLGGIPELATRFSSRRMPVRRSSRRAYLRWFDRACTHDQAHPSSQSFWAHTLLVIFSILVQSFWLIVRIRFRCMGASPRSARALRIARWYLPPSIFRLLTGLPARFWFSFVQQNLALLDGDGIPFRVVSSVNQKQPRLRHIPLAQALSFVSSTLDSRGTSSNRANAGCR